MKLVASFDPTKTNPQGNTFNAGFTSGNRRIVVYNESNVNLMLQWGGFTTYCPAWTAMLYCISTANANIQWSPLSTLNMQNAPVSQVNVEMYENSETIPGTFPASLVRTTQQSNLVGAQSAYNAVTLVTTATGSTILNVATAPGSQSVWVVGIDGSLLGNTSGLQTWEIDLLGLDTSFFSGGHLAWGQDLNQFVSPVLIRLPGPMKGASGGTVQIQSTHGVAGTAGYNVYYFIQ